MKNENMITQAKLDLMKKIIDSRLTKKELNDVKNYTEQLIHSHPRDSEK